MLMDDFVGLKTSVEVPEDVVDIAQELELEVKPEDVTKLLQSHDNEILQFQVLLFMDEQRMLR